jgi:hypothetical protein
MRMGNTRYSAEAGVSNSDGHLVSAAGLPSCSSVLTPPAIAAPPPAYDLFTPRQARHGKPEHDIIRVRADQLVEGATGACPSKCPLNQRASRGLSVRYYALELEWS